MRHLVDLLTICTFIAIVLNILDICEVELFGFIRPSSVYLAKNESLKGIAYTTIIIYLNKWKKTIIISKKKLNSNSIHDHFRKFLNLNAIIIYQL